MDGWDEIALREDEWGEINPPPYWILKEEDEEE